MIRVFGTTDKTITNIGVGRINGWFRLDRPLTRTHTITRDADGGYVITPIEPETEME